MKRSKKIFLVFAGIFMLSLLLVGYDISRRTTFPGAKKNMTERLAPGDSTVSDTTKNKTSSH